MAEVEQNHLQTEVDSLKIQLLEQDQNFSAKRAQFKELYIKKEEELKILNENLKLISQERDKMKEDLNNIQSAVQLSDSFKYEELESIKNEFKNEISSLNKIIKENAEGYKNILNEKNERLKQLEDENECLLKKLDEKNEEISDKTKNILSKVAYKFKLNTQELLKNFQDFNSDNIFEKEITEKNKKETVTEQEDIQTLKNKIRQAYEKIDKLENGAKPSDININHLHDKIKELSNELKFAKTNNENINKQLSDIKSSYFTVEKQLQYYEKIYKIILTDFQRNEVVKFLDNENELKEVTEKKTSINLEEPIKRASSGELFHKCETSSPIVSHRRNTDVQSLKDFKVEASSSLSNKNSNKVKIVDEKEWNKMKERIINIKGKSKIDCEMCANYEDQLQELQNKFKNKDREFNESFNRSLSQMNLIDNLKDSCNKLTSQLNDKASEQEKTIQSLSDKLTEINDSYTKLRKSYETFRNTTDDSLKTIYNERTNMKLRVEKIENLYDDLLMKRSKKARELEEEKIELPDNLEDAQFYLLKLKETIINSRAAIEHLNNTMQSSEMFNKQKDEADKQERDAIFDEISKEKTELQQRIQMLEKELNKRKISSQSADNLDETIKVLKTELDVVKSNFANMENENKKLKSRLQSLQHELENSESVQKDFVKLSQTLQIQLENLRQEDRELRWQFDEDVTNCNDCKMEFNTISNVVPISTGFDFSPRKRHHCLHCGKIFCKQCLCDLNPSKNSNRPATVCKVCHTLLVKDAAPYFSLKR